MDRWFHLLQSMFDFLKAALIDVHLRERREYKVFRALVDSIPGLEERLVSADELIIIAELVRVLYSLFSSTLIGLVAEERCIGGKR